MKSKLFDAEKCEVGAAVLVLILGTLSILAGLSQTPGPNNVAKRLAAAEMIQLAARNLERR